MPTLDEKNEFLKRDLSDTLKWLFVGAVVWQAADPRGKRPECGCHQRALGMYMSFTQARALYEFYFSKEDNRNDDARARHFLRSGAKPKFKSSLYPRYIKGKPANKRVFHLVYRRSEHSGGGESGGDESEHLKNQVLVFARELRQITEEFARHVERRFVRLVQSALEDGLNEGGKVADCFKIANPL
jgi:hypothetical protein